MKGCHGCLQLIYINCHWRCLTEVKIPHRKPKKNLWICWSERQTSWKRETHFKVDCQSVESAKNIELESQRRPTGKIFNLKLTGQTCWECRSKECQSYDDWKFEWALGANILDRRARRSIDRKKFICGEAADKSTNSLFVHDDDSRPQYSLQSFARFVQCYAKLCYSWHTKNSCYDLLLDWIISR